jgi:hypothetical protein
MAIIAFGHLLPDACDGCGTDFTVCDGSFGQSTEKELALGRIALNSRITV